MALVLISLWTVVSSDFDAKAHPLDIHIDFPASSRFICPTCDGSDCPVYDDEQMS